MPEPAPLARRIAIVRNPRSGSAVATETLKQALNQARVTAEILDTPGSPQLDDWLDRISSQYDVIAAAGGDGTVSAVAAGVARAGKILGVIPTGTLNHFAHDAGIPTELARAVEVLRTGVQRGVDAGFVNDRFFLNNVSLGSYPRMVHERTRLEQRGRSRGIASAIAVSKTWWRLRSIMAYITVDGRDLIRRSPFIVVGNGSYVLSGFALGQREDIASQRLSLYVAPRAGRLGALSIPLRALFGRLERWEQFESTSAQQITMSLRSPRVPAGIDGEIRELESPLRFVVRPGMLQVMLPSLDSARDGPELVEGPQV